MPFTSPVKHMISSFFSANSVSNQMFVRSCKDMEPVFEMSSLLGSALIAMT
jgi:hypothetical protein